MDAGYLVAEFVRHGQTLRIHEADEPGQITVSIRTGAELVGASVDGEQFLDLVQTVVWRMLRKQEQKRDGMK